MLIMVCITSGVIIIDMLVQSNQISCMFIENIALQPYTVCFDFKLSFSENSAVHMHNNFALTCLRTFAKSPKIS